MRAIDLRKKLREAKDEIKSVKQNGNSPKDIVIKFYSINAKKKRATELFIQKSKFFFSHEELIKIILQIIKI